MTASTQPLPPGVDGLTSSERALHHQPWQHSTGPRSEAGKAKSSMNSLRHGRETAAKREFRRESFRFLRTVETLLRDLRGGKETTAAAGMPTLLRQADRVRALLAEGGDGVDGGERSD